MNCQAPVPDPSNKKPFADNDGFLPAQDAPVGRCAECDLVHRLDLGCPHAARGRWRLVAVLAAFAIGSAVGAVWGLTR